MIAYSIAEKKSENSETKHYAPDFKFKRPPGMMNGNKNRITPVQTGDEKRQTKNGGLHRTRSRYFPGRRVQAINRLTVIQQMGSPHIGRSCRN
jgi:hypothetical protein